ncbi:MAG: cytidine deaminase [Candidatus Dormibacteraeota bacterium]|nr:cytidine deaminase [Candidatus Dormibacteraeota bacterium]
MSMVAPFSENERVDAAAFTELERRAAEVAERAYAPYSGFRVGAALRTVMGGVYVGANLENGSYGLTNCAERAAVAAAVAAEGPSTRIEAVAIVHPGAEPCSPCGACRQVLVELAAPGAMVRYRAPEGPTIRPLAELLPDTFTLP